MQHNTPHYVWKSFRYCLVRPKAADLGCPLLKGLESRLIATYQRWENHNLADTTPAFRNETETAKNTKIQKWFLWRSLVTCRYWFILLHFVAKCKFVNPNDWWQCTSENSDICDQIFSRKRAKISWKIDVKLVTFYIFSNGWLVNFSRMQLAW